MRIRLSIGTAAVLGLKTLRTDAPPKTAYIMGEGDRCVNNCRFCSQARDALCDDHLLSRVIWPTFQMDQVLPPLQDAFLRGDLERACVQVVLNKGSFDRTLDMVRQLSSIHMPISVSTNVRDREQVEELFRAGAHRLSIAMDGATEEVHREVKSGDYRRKMDLLEVCAKAFPGKISTHFIAGLGETEEEILTAIARMYRLGVTVGLFAFTPVAGTAMEDAPPPPIESYRRIQLANWLIKEGSLSLDDLIFSDGVLRGINLDLSELYEGRNGEPFRTAGCKGCNRPYYNESPGRGPMYNYPRPLTDDEAKRAFLETGLLRLSTVEDLA